MIFDARVHLFPPMLARLIRRAFEREAWPILYPLDADAAIEHLKRRGVTRIAGIVYAAQPGLSRHLNDHMAALARRHGETLVPFGTVHPADPDCLAEAARALDGLCFAGLKLHCHLLHMGPDDKALAPILELLAERGKVLNLHSGRVAKSRVNNAEIRALCNVKRFRRALKRVPTLKVVVPHIGYDEVQPYLDLLAEFPSLHFDTAMAFGGHRMARGEILEDARPLRPPLQRPDGTYPPLPKPWGEALDQLVPQIVARPDRFLFGSDFPNLPYEWEFEQDELARYLPPAVLEQVLWRNAARLFGAAEGRQAAPARAAAP